MTHFFLDTSALGKRYHPEVGTPEVDRIMDEADARHVISRLTAIEILSVFAGKVRMGVIDVTHFALLRRRFLTDVTQRRLQVIRMTGFHYQEAGRIIRVHGPTHRVRTLDALQLSVALELRRRGILGHVVCADKGFIMVARAEGLSVINPEEP